MQQLNFLEPGRLEWQEVDEPALDGGGIDALVRPVAVATCDLDTAAVHGQAPMAGPFPFGHEFVGDVVEVGAQVSSVRPGDRVVVPFQISCGHCDRCQRGMTGSCRSVPAMASFGLGAIGGLQWGGALSDLVRVPYADAMAVTLPAGLDPVAVASMSDNIPDGWRAVAPALERWPRAPVLIVGGGAVSVPFYAAQIALALGAERVDYLDTDPERLARAERIGANPVERTRDRYPVTVDASGTPDGLRRAIRSTDAGGTCTGVAIHWDDVALPLLGMYSKGITFVTARVDARSIIPKALELVERGALHPGLVTETVADWDAAAQVLAGHTAKTVIAR